MNKRIFALLMFVTCLPLFCGCQLAKPEAGETQPDRLVGVYITINQDLSPFDGDSFLKSDMEKIIDNVGKVVDGVIPDLASREEERIYGELVEWTYNSWDGVKYTRPKYEFPGIDGVQLAAYLHEEGYDSDDVPIIPIQNWDDYYDEAVGDFHYVVNEVGLAEITGTVYIDSNVKEMCAFLNPIYQTESGEVYILPGDEYVNVTQENALGYEGICISDTYTDENGETQETKVTVTFKLDEAAETVDFIQMDSDNNVIRKDMFAGTETPDYFTPQEDTAYIIVEEHGKDGSINYSMYDKDVFFIKVSCSSDSELLSIKETAIKWPGAEE